MNSYINNTCGRKTRTTPTQWRVSQGWNTKVNSVLSCAGHSFRRFQRYRQSCNFWPWHFSFCSEM